MRIDCKHVWEHISAYIDGEVDADLRADIDRHLETCEICSAVLDSTRNVVILVADDRVFELPAGFSDRLHARIERELEKPGGMRSSRSTAVSRNSAGRRRSRFCEPWDGSRFPAQPGSGLRWPEPPAAAQTVSLRAEFAPPPLCGGPVAQMANPGQHREIQQGANRRHNQHGNANSVLMPSLCWRIDTAGRCQCRKSDRHANPADRQNRGTQALQKSNIALVQPIVRSCLTLIQKPRGSHFSPCGSFILLLNLHMKCPRLSERSSRLDARQPQTKAAHARGQSKCPPGPFIRKGDRCKEFHFHLAPFPCNLSRMPALLECVHTDCAASELPNGCRAC